MARTSVIRFAGALWLWCAPGVAAAGLPLGSFDFTLGGNQSIWWEAGADGAGEATFCERFAASFGDVEHCQFDLVVIGKGRISGFATFAASRDGLRVALAGPIKGSRRGDGETGHSKASYKIKLAGEASDGQATLGVKASIGFSGRVAPGGVASGTWEERYCFEGERCESIRTPAPTETLTNGNWDVELEIADAGGGALSGSARVGFADGSECPYDLSGKYDAKSDLADLALTPVTPACAGTSIQLQDVGFPEPMAAPRSRNQEVFAFICAGTVTIAASVDASACSWSVFGDGQPAGAESEQTLRIGRMKYELFGFSGQGYVFSVGSMGSQAYGRAYFDFFPKRSTVFTVVSNLLRPGTIFNPIVGQPLPGQTRAEIASDMWDLLQSLNDPQFGFR